VKENIKEKQKKEFLNNELNGQLEPMESSQIMIDAMSVHEDSDSNTSSNFKSDELASSVPFSTPAYEPSVLTCNATVAEQLNSSSGTL